MPLTRQEMFTQAYLGLAAQGFQISRKGHEPMDRGPDLSCAYRSPEGLKCAIGHLIPDDRYDPKMDETTCDTGDGTAIFEIWSHFQVFQDLIDASDLDFASELQGKHDGGADPSTMRILLERFAIDNNITVPIIPE